MRILIADDHAPVRRGLKELLLREIESAVCGEAQDAEQALAEVQHHDWDLVILDLTMPGRSGLDILGELRQLRSRTPVLILSMHPEDPFGKQALEAGASGYMTKDTAPEELIRAVRAVLAGGRYVSRTLAEKLAGPCEGAV